MNQFPRYKQIGYEYVYESSITPQIGQMEDRETGSREYREKWRSENFPINSIIVVDNGYLIFLDCVGVSLLCWNLMHATMGNS